MPVAIICCIICAISGGMSVGPPILGMAPEAAPGIPAIPPGIAKKLCMSSICFFESATSLRTDSCFRQ